MKNRIRFVLTILVLVWAVPMANPTVNPAVGPRLFSSVFPTSLPMTASAAETGSGTLTADKNNVAVSLRLPAGKTEGITSLRLKLRVSLISGSMGKPDFVFGSAVKSEVKDAHISKEKDGSYLVDIIVSGKKEQKLFADSETLRLGTLVVAPTSGHYQIKVSFTGQTGDKPEVTYVDREGLNSVTAALSKADAVIVSASGSQPVPPAPDSPGTQPDSSFGKKLKLTVSAKNGSNRVSFRWTRDEGADGYVLYRYHTSKKKYVRMKTVSGSKTVSYSKKCSYGKRYSFKVRSYRKAADGTKVYGKMSAASKVKVAPAKVKGVSVRSQGYGKIALSWKKVSKAKGYQIFGSQEKDGEYSRIKTVTVGKTKNIQIRRKKNEVTYYKVRAFVKGIQKKRVYGKFSAVRSAGDPR